MRAAAGSRIGGRRETGHFLDASWTAGVRPGRLALAFAAAVFFAALALRRDATLHSTALDLALFTNILYNTAHGSPFASWVPPFAMGNYLADHLSPILLLFAAPFAAWPDPRLLLALQSAILAAGALPVGDLAERRLGSRPAGLLFAAAYLAYPFVGYLNLWDFHQESVLLVGLLFAFDLADRGRMGAMLGALALVLATKEEAGLAVAAFGVYLALRYRRPRLGVGVTLAGLAWFGLAVAVVIPRFRDGLPFVYNSRYAQFGPTPLAAGLAILLHPRSALAFMLTPDRLVYLRDLFGPLPLALLGPLPLLTSLPVLLGNLLSAMPEQYQIAHHYPAGIAPGIVVGAIEGAALVARAVARLSGLWAKAQEQAARPEGPARDGLQPESPATGLQSRDQMPTARIAEAPVLGTASRNGVGSIGALLAGLTLAACLVANLQTSPLAYARERGWFVDDPARRAALDRIAALVPPEASLAATWNVAPHVAARPVLATFPMPLVRTEYALVDLDETYTYQYPRDVKAAVEQAKGDGYAEVARDGSFVLLRRPPTGEARPLDTSAVTTRLDRRFADGVTLVDASYEPKSAGGRVALTLRWRLDAPTAQLYGVRLRLQSRTGAGGREWWYGLSPRLTPWTPREGGLLVDRYDLPLPADAGALLLADLVVEPYQWPSQSFLAPAGGSSPLALRVAAPERAGASGAAINARFGDLAVLESADVPRREIAPGETLAGALRFRALAATDLDYTVSVQLVGEAGLVAQADGLTGGGLAPTSGWRPGDVVDHRFGVSVPSTARAGRYRLVAVLYDGKTGARLSVGAESFAALGEVKIR